MMLGIFMRISFLADQVNQLHWSVLKNCALSMALLPLAQLLPMWLAQYSGAEQMMMAFIAISLWGAVALIAFIYALQMTREILSGVENKTQYYLVSIYCHLPMMIFAILMSFIVTHHPFLY